MTKPVVQIFIEDDETVNMLWDQEYQHILSQLGILEWAKAVLIEALKIDNAIEAYGEEEA